MLDSMRTASTSTANIVLKSRRGGRRGTRRAGKNERTHQSRKPLERPWDPNTRVYLYQDSLGGMDVNL